jgi:hypothetical protein
VARDRLLQRIERLERSLGVGGCVCSTSAADFVFEEFEGPECTDERRAEAKARHSLVCPLHRKHIERVVVMVPQGFASL